MCSWLCLSPEVVVRCVLGCVSHLKWRSGVFVAVFALLKWRFRCVRGCVCSPEVMVRCVRGCHLKWRSGVFVAVFVT